MHENPILNNKRPFPWHESSFLFQLRIYCACSVHSKKGWLLVALSFRVCWLPIDRLAQNSLQGRRSWTFLAFRRSWHFWSGHIYLFLSFSCHHDILMKFSAALFEIIFVSDWETFLFLAFKKAKIRLLLPTYYYSSCGARWQLLKKHMTSHLTAVKTKTKPLAKKSKKSWYKTYTQCAKTY